MSVKFGFEIPSDYWKNCKKIFGVTFLPHRVQCQISYGWSSVIKVEARTYDVVVENHLKLVEVEPPLRLLRVEVVIRVAGGIAKRVEFAPGIQQKRRRSFLVHKTRITAVPPKNRHQSNRGLKDSLRTRTKFPYISCLCPCLCTFSLWQRQRHRHITLV